MYHQPSEMPRSQLSYMHRLWRKMRPSTPHEGQTRATRATSLEVGAFTEGRRRGSDSTMGTMSSSMMGGELRDADVVPQQFTATAVSSNGARVNGMLTVTHNALLWHAHNTPSVTWPLLYLRRYGYDNALFTIECGRRCRTGAGVFTFVCRDAHAVFHAVQSSIEIINAHKMMSTRRPRLSNCSMESATFGTRGRTPDIVLPRDHTRHDEMMPRTDYSNPRAEYGGARHDYSTPTAEFGCAPRHDYCTPNAPQLMMQLRGKPRRSQRSSEGEQRATLPHHRRLGSAGNDVTHLAANTSLSERVSSTSSMGLSSNSVFDSSPATSSPTSRHAPQHEYVNVGRDARSASLCVGANTRALGAQNNDYINCPVLLSASTSNVDCDYVTLEVGATSPSSAPPVLGATPRRHSTMSVGTASTTNNACYAVIDTVRTKALRDTYRQAQSHRRP